MDRVANKTVKLSTLQTLCLLNMISSAGKSRYVDYPNEVPLT